MIGAFSLRDVIILTGRDYKDPGDRQIVARKNEKTLEKLEGVFRKDQPSRSKKVPTPGMIIILIRIIVLIRHS